MNSQSEIPQEPEMSRSPFPIPTVTVRDELRWEYRSLRRDLSSAEPPTDGELNELGAQGWELAGAVNKGTLLYLYFKRLA
jgi:hypothetical protein